MATINLILKNTKILLSTLLFLSPLSASAHLLSITPIIFFPTSVAPFSTTTASFMVTNTTSSTNVYAINQSIFASGSGFSISNSTCGSLLAPGASCIIQVNLTAPAVLQASTGSLKLWAKPSLDFVDYCLNVANSAVQYAYVTDNTNDNLYQCSLNAVGSFSSCSVIHPTGTAGWLPYSITFATTSTGTQYGYVTDNVNKLYQCSFSGSGNLSSCSVVAAPVGGWSPLTVTFQMFGGSQYDYVVDGSHNKIYQCPLNSKGQLGACSSTLSSGYPQSVAFATAQNGQAYAYVAGGISNTVDRCVVNSATGVIGSCSSTPTTPPAGWTPLSIAFATTQNGTQFAYVADTTANVIYQCGLNTDGTFSSCTPTPSTPPTGWNTVGISFATQAGIEYAYVADNNGHVYQCGFNVTNGNLSNCTATPSTGAPAWLPNQIGFAAS